MLLQILCEFNPCAHRNFTGLIRWLLCNHQILKECQERVWLALLIHGLSSSDLDAFSFHLYDFYYACVVFHFISIVVVSIALICSVGEQAAAYCRRDPLCFLSLEIIVFHFFPSFLVFRCPDPRVVVFKVVSFRSFSFVRLEEWIDL